MQEIKTALLIFIIYLVQALVAVIMNLVIHTRNPRSFIDGLKLTILPYVLYCGVFDRKKLD